MSADSVMKRPGGVTFVAIIIAVLGVLSIFHAVWMFILSLSSSATLNALFQGEPVSRFTLLLMAALSFLLGLIYWWIVQLVMIGSASARIIIIMITIINIVFALFNMPYGLLPIVLNLIVLAMVNTASAKVWFLQSQ